MMYEEKRSDLNAAVGLLNDALDDVFNTERVNDMQLKPVRAFILRSDPAILYRNSRA